MQHAISDCTRSQTGRSVLQTNPDRLPSPLPPRALPPSFHIFLFFFFTFLPLCFSDVFCSFFVLFTEPDCHSNRSNYRLVQRSPAMLNRYVRRHLCMCESVCALHSYAVGCVFPCALVRLHMFFTPLFVIPYALDS